MSGRVVGGDRRIPSYGGESIATPRRTRTSTYSCCCSNRSAGSGRVREILWKAADVLQNKLTRAQYLDEVTWTTKNWFANNIPKPRIGWAAEAAYLGRSSHHTRQSQSRL